ncbi:MAG: hypothetical protein WKG00_29295 [Polyangiaceae bacterium]
MSKSDTPPSTSALVGGPVGGPVRGPAAVGDAEDRDAILARRAFFIAGAVAGLTMAACEPRAADPVPCLSVALVDAGSGNEITDAGEQVAIDGGGDAAPVPGRDSGAADAAPADAGFPPLFPVDGSVGDGGKPLPAPCLRMVPPKQPPPQPCLSVKPPETQ